jgi:hypothetical protein
VAEARKKIADKAGYFGFPAGFIVFFVFARFFGLLVGFICGFIAMGLAWKAAEMFLEKKYLDPIEDYSDQMLVARYNESKADQRAAGTRTTIWRAVFAIILVLLIIGWLAARRP